jgi:hypothetical protein
MAIDTAVKGGFPILRRIAKNAAEHGVEHQVVKEGRFASLLVRDRELADSLSEGFHELWRKSSAMNRW